MKSIARGIVGAATAFSLWSCAPTMPTAQVQEAPAPTNVAARHTAIDTTLKEELLIRSSSPIDISNLPISDLSQVLREDKRHNLFRMTWFFSAGSFTSSGEALYNRKQGTVKESVAEGDWNFYGKRSQLYAHISDDMIHRMNRDLADKGSGPFSFRPLLKYGAVQVKGR